MCFVYRHGDTSISTKYKDLICFAYDINIDASKFKKKLIAG